MHIHTSLNDVRSFLTWALGALGKPESFEDQLQHCNQCLRAGRSVAALVFRLFRVFWGEGFVPREPNTP